MKHFLLLLLLVVSANAVIISPERTILYSPGVKGGIPTYTTTINVRNAPYNAVGDGVADDTAAITNAIYAAGLNTIIYLPAGTYKTTSQILIQNKSVILKGDGPSLTRIVPTFVTTGSDSAIYFKGASSSTPVVLTGGSGGADRDSTTLTFVDGSALAAGNFIRLLQSNDPTVLNGNIPGGPGITNTSAYYIMQINQIATKPSVNVITLDRPLYRSYDSTGTYNTRAVKTIMTTNCGVENLFIDNKHSKDGTIGFFQAADCWVRGVESTNANWFHVSINTSFRIEIRSNYFHHATTYGQGGYGFTLANSTDCWVEDNIFYKLRHSAIIQNGSSGNVVSFNWSSSMYNVDGEAVNFMMVDFEFHGGFPNFNLVEGNEGQKGGGDDYWGNSQYNTFHRNHFRRYHEDKGSQINSAVWAMQIFAKALNYNVLGNVYGLSGQTGVSTNGWGASDAGDPYDPLVLSTVLDHGNHSLISGVTTYATGIIEAIPTSYIYSSKPTFFGNCAWPLNGPDVLNKTNMTPAHARYIGLSYPYFADAVRSGIRGAIPLY